MSEKHSDTGIIKARFPAYAWLPRWTRTYLTPQNVLAMAVGLFSAGVWWDNHERSADLKGIRNDINAARKTMDEQVLKKSDIKVLTFQVEQMWSWYRKADVEANTNLQPIAKPAPAAFEPPKK